MSNLSTASGGPSISSSGGGGGDSKSAPQSSGNTTGSAQKRKRSLPGTPDPDAEVIALSPRTLLTTNRFVCEICNKGFQRDQNLQLHRRGHNLPWKLKQRSGKEVKKRVYICPETSCVHHDPARALGDLTGVKKHFCRKHGEKKWKCDKCSKRYAVQSDWKAHSKTCGTREYRCDCGTLFSRRDSFITHRAFCDALAEESARVSITANNGIMGIGMGMGMGTGMTSLTHNNNNNHMVALKKSGSHGVEGMARSPHGHYQQQPQRPGDGKELHMFVWSSSASPVSEANHMFGVNHDLKDARPIHPTDNSSKGYHESSASYDEFSHIKKGSDDYGGGREVEMASPMNSKLGQAEYRKDGSVIAIQEQASSMPPASVMTRLILIMVWRKLIRNPNTYASALGLIWSLVSFRFNIEMPKIIHGSISILSDAGLGMAMVSLGLFMALQPKIIACGKSVAAFAMAVRFLTGPAVMAASSIVIGLRGPLLHLAIVQAALPQGIVPFVFAKEYNVHPEILSTAVIFGMLIALPITLLYYIFLGL